MIGAFLQNVLQMGIDALTGVVDNALAAAGVNKVIHSLVIDGIFAGVGSVLSFLPIIVTLFFFLSLMEDSGYIARVAFFMDKLLRKIGLSGTVHPNPINIGTILLPDRLPGMKNVLQLLWEFLWHCFTKEHCLKAKLFLSLWSFLITDFQA